MMGFTRRGWGLAVVALSTTLGGGAAFGQCPLQGTTPATIPTPGNTAVTLQYGSTMAWPLMDVEWNGESVEIVDTTLESCTVRSRPGQGTVTIRFVSLFGSCTSSNVVRYAPPTITSLSSPSANVGATLVITGADFGTVAPQVQIGGRTAQVTGFIPHTMVQVTVPPGLQPGVHAVVVIAGFQFSAPAPLDVTPSIAVDSWFAPVRSTAGGDMILVRGTGFGPTPVLDIAGATVATIWSTDTELVARLPAGVGVNRPLAVYNLAEDTFSESPTPFSYDAPTITNVSPASVPAGEPGTLTIYGKNFGGGSIVTIGGIAASVVSASHEQIVVQHGPLNPGTPIVQVVAGGQVGIAPVQVVATCSADTNGDGVVNFADLNAVLEAFGAACQSLLR